MTEQQKLILDAYLKKLENALSPLSVAERSDILLELNAHISDSLNQSQRTLEEILKNLGSPEAVALGYLEQRGINTPHSPSQYIPPAAPKSNNGCFKWGCVGCVGLLVIMAILIFFLFNRLGHFVTALQSGEGFNGSFLNVDSNGEKVSLLNGWMQVDGKNETVKIGNLLSVDGKNEQITMGDNVHIDGKKSRVIIQESPTTKKIALSREEIFKKFGQDTMLATALEFQANTEGWLITSITDESLASLLDLSEGDTISSINNQSIFSKSWTIADLSPESTWTYTHNNKSLTLIVILSDSEDDLNLNFQIQNP